MQKWFFSSGALIFFGFVFPTFAVWEHPSGCSELFIEQAARGTVPGQFRFDPALDQVQGFMKQGLTIRADRTLELGLRVIARETGIPLEELENGKVWVQETFHFQPEYTDFDPQLQNLGILFDPKVQKAAMAAVQEASRRQWEDMVGQMNQVERFGAVYVTADMPLERYPHLRFQLAYVARFNGISEVRAVKLNKAPKGGVFIEEYSWAIGEGENTAILGISRETLNDRDFKRHLTALKEDRRFTTELFAGAGFERRPIGGNLILGHRQAAPGETPHSFAAWADAVESSLAFTSAPLELFAGGRGAGLVRQAKALDLSTVASGSSKIDLKKYLEYEARLIGAGFEFEQSAFLPPPLGPGMAVRVFYDAKKNTDHAALYRKLRDLGMTVVHYELVPATEGQVRRARYTEDSIVGDGHRIGKDQAEVMNAILETVDEADTRAVYGERMVFTGFIDRNRLEELHAVGFCFETEELVADSVLEYLAD